MLAAVLLLLTPMISASSGGGPFPVDLSRVAFVIMSQARPPHDEVATRTQHRLEDALRTDGVDEPVVYMLHEDVGVPSHGGWTYFPVLTALGEEEHLDWLLFLEENSLVDLHILTRVLARFDPRDEVHVGHALEDEDHVVIHHYDSPGLQWAHPAGGIALSGALVRKVATAVPRISSDESKFPVTFSIDASYEMAKVIDQLDKEKDEKPAGVEPQNWDDKKPLDRTKVDIRHDERFCVAPAKKGQNCAVSPSPNATCPSLSDEKVLAVAKETLFAVKTCAKYHAERLAVVADTWGRSALQLEFFSEAEDAIYGTKVLPGVVNVERGHCYKTFAMLKYFLENAVLRGWKWMVIADDDSVMGVRRTLEEIACVGMENRDALLLGQRYGFHVATGEYGYDYVTGGGGMIVNAAAARKLTHEGGKADCTCRTPDAPDDMHLGACLAHRGLSVTHSPAFHQARPEDYHEKMRNWPTKPASFHKHWMTNPRATYDEYFRESDAILAKEKQRLASREEL